MTTPIDLMIPMEVPSQNVTQRWCWQQRKREVDRWAVWFRHSMRPGGMDNATGKRHVVITAYRKALIRDHANLVGGCKGMIDALVRVGLLLDDDTKRMTAEYHQELASKSPTGKPCTRIAITDA